MWGKIWAYVKRFWGWLCAAFGVLLLIAGGIADLVGRSTFIDDLSLLLQRAKPVTDFFSRQPEWAFYPLCILLILVGLAATAANWRPVLRRLEAAQASVATQVAPSPSTPPSLPNMGFGEVIRYIASDSIWGVSMGSREDWIEQLEREIVDRLAHQTLQAYGRFLSTYGDNNSTRKMDKIDADFWSEVTFSADEYFGSDDDYNSVDGGSFGYSDIKLYRTEVERVWPKRGTSSEVKLPLLKDALANRARAQSGKK